MAFTNSPMVDYTKISPNRTSPRNHAIDTITIHCVVGQLTAEVIASLFVPKERQASCNYCVGLDGRIGLICEEKDRSWCSSSRANDHRAITIETACDLKAPYAVRPVVYEALIKLCADICQRNGKTRMIWIADKNKALDYDPSPEEMRMTLHRWFANTSCPGDWLIAHMQEIADRVNAILDTKTSEAEEKNPYQEEDDDMDVNRFKELYTEMRKEFQDNDASDYSAEARAWATGNGLVVGNGTTVNGEPNCMWGDVLTREQFVTVLYRFAQKMGKV